LFTFTPEREAIDRKRQDTILNETKAVPTCELAIRLREIK